VEEPFEIEQRSYEPAPESLAVDRLRAALRSLMNIEEVRVLTNEQKPAVQFAGHLVEGDQDAIFEEIVQRFADLGYTPLLTEAEDEHHLQAIPAIADKKTGKPWVNILLFVLTLLSTLYIGAFHENVIPARLQDILKGWPFALTLLAILTAHEMSHYFAGRRHGSPASLPYFIPLPLPGSLGTLGAVIVQRSPMRSRKALFDIGVAGPIGGLLVAIPLLFIGLALSEVGTPQTFMDIPAGEPIQVLQEGNSVLYLAAKYIVHGRILPDKATGEDVWLSPPSTGGSIAFAAWVGLLVTMLNLFPVGQLDGGHVAYAMWGRTAWKIARFTLMAIFGWGVFLLLWQNYGGMTWLMIGSLGLLIGPRHPAPLNDLTPLDARRKALGWAMVVIFFLILTPIPWMTVTL
jgi:membrane-associated protease RseP (regulator of RpoE activity)